MQGLVQSYTGKGKGKTTAAIGLAIRAAGAGLKIFIAQFVKGQIYSEIKLIRERIPEIEIEQFGRKCFIKVEPQSEDKKLARKGFKTVQEKISCSQYDLVILDEIFIALHYNLVTEEEVLNLIKTKPENVEIILTGRKASQGLLEASDLVTEMHEIKHYFKKGIKARKGIEY